MRFLGLQLEDRVPDSKTVWTFREKLKNLNLVEVLFARFYEQLAAQGYVARTGQMIDATFVEVPKQRNSREENAQIKVMCQHFFGHKVKQILAAIRSLLATNSYCKNEVVHDCKILQYIRIYLV